MATKEEASSDFSSALCLVVGKLNDWLSLVFFLGVQGAPRIPVGTETFSSCLVCWSSEATNLFEWAFGEAIAKEESVCVPGCHKKNTTPHSCPLGRDGEWV